METIASKTILFERIFTLLSNWTVESMKDNVKEVLLPVTCDSSMWK
jgi:hypothetical protein